MRPDLHTVLRRQDERGESRGRVAGVEAARHVRRRDERRQLGVERTALAEVAIEVDLHPLSPLSPLDSALTRQDNRACSPWKSHRRGTAMHGPNLADYAQTGAGRNPA